jgi:transcription-repair coupling factor (superfamily II helicase)
MLEEKIEEIKQNPGEKKPDIADIKIDLAVEASLPDVFFQSETDKLNFYREIEMLTSIEELEHMREDFEKIESTLPDFVNTLFDILKCKLYAKKYIISAIRKIGINYQIDFHDAVNVETLKSFLRLDSEIFFQVVNIKRLRSPTKHFPNDEKFLQYLLRMFEGKI